MQTFVGFLQVITGSRPRPFHKDLQCTSLRHLFQLLKNTAQFVEKVPEGIWDVQDHFLIVIFPAVCVGQSQSIADWVFMQI